MVFLLLVNRKVREWEVKVKNREAIQKRELEQDRKKVEDSEYIYRRCLMLEEKIYEMEVGQKFAKNKTDS